MNNTQTPQHNEKLTLFILITLTAIGPLALNIFIPSMPGIRRVFATDYGTVQLTLTLYLAATAVAQLFIGSLSDRFGRRPVLLSGLALFLAGSLLSALAGSIELLIASRIVQAVGGCAGMVLSRAIVRDLYDPETAASKMAYVFTAMVVAPMLAPTIGGFLDVWFGWRSGFLAVALFAAAVMVLTAQCLRETHHDLQPMPGIVSMLSGFATLLRTPIFCSYALVSAFGTAMFFAFLAGAPYIMIELLEHPPSDYGLYFIIISLSFMSGSFCAGRVSRRFGIDRMIMAGCSLSVLATALFVALAVAGIFTPMAIFGPMMLVAFSNGISLPNSTTAAISANPKMIGSSSGLAGFLQISISAVVTFIVGQLQDQTQWPMIIVMTLASGLAFAAFVWSRVVRRAERR